MIKFTPEQLQQIRQDFDLIQVGATTLELYLKAKEQIETNDKLRKVIIEKNVCRLDPLLCNIEPSIRWCIYYEGRPTINGIPLLEWWVPTKEQAVELCSLFGMEIDYIIDEDVPTIKSILGAENSNFNSLINLNLKKLDPSTANQLRVKLARILNLIAEEGVTYTKILPAQTRPPLSLDSED